jgi:hypothetical protein
MKTNHFRSTNSPIKSIFFEEPHKLLSKNGEKTENDDKKEPSFRIHHGQGFPRLYLFC